jgi:putative ABC transport system permease protein
LLPLLDRLFFSQDQILKIYYSDLLNASLRIFLLIFPILFVILLPIFKDLFKLEIKELFQGRYSLNQKKHNWLYYLPAIFVLLGLSIWQSQSFKVGGIFFSVLVLSCLLIVLFYRFVLISLTKFFNRFSYIFRHSFLYLNKNFISTGSFVLSLSLGTLLILLIPILKDTLQDEIHSDQTKVPGLFLFDIQPDQLDPLETLLLKDNLKLTFKSPLIRGRLLKINNQVHQIKKSNSWFKTQEDDQRERFQARVLNFSTRKTFSDTETIVSGKPFAGSFDWNKDQFAEVSLEVRFADRYGIKLNDQLTFDIQGLEVNTIVTSLRSVKWTSFQPNFFILFQPGVLEDAPQTYLASIPTLSPERAVLVQKSIVDDFPNISILNVHELVKKTLDFTIKISRGIQLMAALTILIGFFILYILGQSAFYERLYSLSLLRVVGMRKSSLLKMIFFEFSFLAIFAVSLGGILAILISMLLSYFLFDRMPIIPFQTVFEIYFLVLILSYLVTFLSFFGFFKIKPIILLREQVSQN